MVLGPNPGVQDSRGLRAQACTGAHTHTGASELSDPEVGGAGSERAGLWRLGRPHPQVLLTKAVGGSYGCG